MTTVLESLNTHLHKTMQDERVYMIGEDLLDPYGGAFKVVKGLSNTYPDRVLTSPVSEAGIVGVAGGMALRGLRPVVEIMFGDFTTLIADQVINSLTKFRWMYNDQVDVPIVIRTPMGGRRGYGPTHSQTLEKLFLGVPGLRVLAPCSLGDPGQLLADAILTDNMPVFFIENKLLYLKAIQTEANLPDFTITTLPTPNSYAPTYTLTIKDAPPPTLTITAYGYMAELVREAALRLAYEKEIFTEIIVPTQLTPLADQPRLPTPLLTSVRKTRRLLTIEEGTLTLGWGAEIITRAKEALGESLINAQRVAAPNHPIPASVPMEKNVLPNADTIMQSALKMV